MTTPIDPRSGTVTRATAAIRPAMAEAEVGDDVVESAGGKGNIILSRIRSHPLSRNPI